MPLDYNDLLVFLMDLGRVVKGVQFGNRMKCESHQADTDLRGKLLLSLGCGDVYVTPRCHSFPISWAFVLSLALGRTGEIQQGPNP